MNKQVGCFQILVWSGMISQSYSGWLWHYPFLEGRTVHFTTAESFSVCWIVNVRLKIPDNLYSRWPRKHLCPKNHLIVLKNICIKNKTERKKERKKTRKSPFIMFVSVCVVTSSSNLARLIYVPLANDPQNKEHSRRLATVQLILQQILVGKCVYIRVPFMMSRKAREFHRGGRKKGWLRCTKL